MSSKVTGVLEELFDQKTQYIIYFWKPLVKSRSMMMTLVIFESYQEDLENLDVFLIGVLLAQTHNRDQ